MTKVTEQRTIRFTVPGPVVPKGRHRSVIRGGRIATFTPAETVAYEKAVAWHALAAMGGRPMLEGALAVRIEVIVAVPRSATKARRAAMLAGAIRPTARPDLDNQIKALLDALNALAFADDAQIVELHAARWYGEEPRATIEVTQI